MSENILAQLDTGLKFERGFWRHPHTGAAMINGRQMGSPSGAWKNHGENTFNLQKWTQRMMLAGVVSMMGDEDWGLFQSVQGRDPNDDGREDYDSLARRSLERAKANEAAKRGTVAHLVTELEDQGDWIGAIEEGLELGLGAQLQDAIRTAWLELLDRHELTVLAIEQTVVCRRLNLAGTLDRVAVTGKSLTFTRRDGSEVTIPEGTILVLDVKTGGLKVDRNGHPHYWAGYALQVLAYADSDPVEVSPTEAGKVEFKKWKDNPSTEHALIAHLDLAGALDTGTLTARLFYVDLMEAEKMAEAMNTVKYARKAGYFGLGGELVVADVDTASRVRSWLQDRIDVIGAHTAARRDLSRLWPRDIGRVTELPDSRIDEVVGLLNRIEAEHGIPFGPTDPRQPRLVEETKQPTNQGEQAS